jgi:hypothetical protein
LWQPEGLAAVAHRHARGAVTGVRVADWPRLDWIGRLGGDPEFRGFRVWIGVGALLALLVVAVWLIVAHRGHEQRLNAGAVPHAHAVAAAALAAKGFANDERGCLMTGDRRFVAQAARRTCGP